MKKIIFSLILAGLPYNIWAQNTCNINEQKPVQLLSAELKRSFPTLKKQNPPIYYMSYTYTDSLDYTLVVENNGVVRDLLYHNTLLKVLPRAGSTQMDNTRTLKQHETDYEQPTSYLPDFATDTQAFTTAVWRATQEAAEKAQQDFARVQADVQTASERADDSPDFAFPPRETFCEDTPIAVFDTERIKQLLLKASTLAQNKPYVLKSEFIFTFEQGSRYFVDSVGTRLKTPIRLVTLSYSLEGKTADGTNISRLNNYNVLQEKELPSEEQLLADVKQSLQELEALSKAPEMEPITVPAILKNKAMAVFVHEVLGHRAEGHRQKEDSFGKTFTDKLGQEIVSPLLTIVDDATLPYFNNIPLRGFYLYDDEGVKARPVTLVENGVFKGFLMNASPIKGFAASNGHGRSDKWSRPVARMGNTRTLASQTVSYDELEKQLLQEIKKQNKPYGIIIEDLSGGFTLTETFLPQTFKLTPTLIYRLYPDGRKEVVRGVDMVGTPLASFHEVLAAADDYGIFNGKCGAESGWVPVSSIAPSVLLRRLELEKASKSGTKPPVLPPPFAEGK
ncbi:MAG: hypothetical protein J6Y25_05035 [Elusimicrobiaceae bacterium]|nr:hypothetical protein [Elusimicrobiaceae bacterium]